MIRIGPLQCLGTGGRCFFATVLLVLGVVGCQNPNNGSVSVPTQSDRLIRFYSELSSGRFAVLADFEDPVHRELFHIESASGRAQFAWDQKRGRPETGGRCLRLVADGPGDVLVMNNDHADRWYLKRDWRAYDLLLVSMRARPIGRSREEVGLTVDLMVGGAPEKERVTVRTSVALGPGWNQVRLDLADLGEKVPLDDVRELRFSVRGTDRPVELLLDDVLLTGYRENHLGNPDDADGGLYVQRVGRRWNVGAGGRFELTFARGQIVAWYDLAVDPLRTRNLVAGTTLGPSPVPLVSSVPRDERGASGERGGFSDDRRVRAASRLLEVNPVRVVVACHWWTADGQHATSSSDSADESAAQPDMEWVYTIYPTGQVFVSVTCDGDRFPLCGPDNGLAYAMTDASAKVFAVVSQPAEAEGGSAGFVVPQYGTLQSVSGATLLGVSGTLGDQATIEASRDVDRKRALLTAAPWRGAGGSRRCWTSHFFLGSGSGLDGDEVEARARAYTKPVALQMELGSVFVSPSEGVVSDGFDRAAGCYVLTHDRGRVRLVIDGRPAPCYTPAFKVLQSARTQAWVYVNDQLLSPTSRDRNGNLIFQLPRTIRDRTVVEVLLGEDS